MAKKKKKKKKIFWPLYKLIVCIFMVLIVVGLAFVYNSLAKYEKRQQLEKEKIDLTQPVVEEVPEIEEEPFDPEKTAIAIVAPNNYKITVNGMTIPSSSLFQTETLKQEAYFEDYIPEGYAFPKMGAFYIEGIEEGAEVKCFSETGEEAFVESSTYPFYQFGFTELPIPADKTQYFNDLVTKYVRLCLNEGELDEILGYFIKGTDTYNNICKIEDVKEYSGRKSGYSIGNVTFTHFNKYAENLYRVQLDFSYTVKNGEVTRDNPTTLDCYVVVIDGQWKVLRMDISSQL